LAEPYLDAQRKAVNDRFFNGKRQGALQNKASQASSSTYALSEREFSSEGFKAPKLHNLLIIYIAPVL